MTAALIISIVAVTVLSTVCVLLTVQFRRTLDSAFLHARMIHERGVKQSDSLLDRLMSMDFAQFKSWQSVEGADEGSFEPPVEEGEVEITGPPKWGHLSALRDRFEQTPEEQSLLEEDFVEEMS